MEFASIFRELRRRRLLVALGALLAVALAVMSVVKAGDSSRSAVASQRLVVDTVSSQLVLPTPRRALNLGWQSMLAGYGLATEESERVIAGELGIEPGELVITVPRIETPASPTPLPERAAEVATTYTEPYVLSVGLNPKLPLISVNATGPDREAARRLTEAAARELQSLPQRAELQTSFVVEVASQIRTREIQSSPRRAPGIVAAFVCFLLWCAGLLIVPAVGRFLGVGRPDGIEAQEAGAAVTR